MSNQRIRVGIVGLNSVRGWAHDAHLPALRALSDDYEVTAVCTSRIESARESASAFDIAHAFADPVAMAEHPEVDLVVVTVKVPEHDRLVRAGLNACKHVWCEWPLAMDSTQAAALVALAEAQGVRHIIGLQSRASPTLRYARDLVKDGYIGQLRSSSLIASGMAWGAYTDQANAYNLDERNRVTMETVPFGHFADALGYCLAPMAQFNALQSRLYERTTVIESGESIAKSAGDQLLVQGLLTDGAAFSIHYRGGFSKGTNLHWEINGTEGDLLITAPLGHLQLAPLQLQGASADAQALSALQVPDAYVNAAVPTGMGWNVGHLYAELASAFKDPAATMPAWVADFGDAVRLHSLVEDVERAAWNGCAVRRDA